MIVFRGLMGREFKAVIVLWMIAVVLSLLTVVSYNQEAAVLLSLKKSLRDPYDVLQSWNSTTVSPCRWFHVTCNIEDSVVRIDLPNTDLSGQLVPQLGLLSNLQYLEILGNNISGQIPSELGNLTNLVSLDLGMNSFTGPIPETLGRLTKLRFLRLNNNSLSGSIPMSLTNIASLQVLDLSNNLLSGLVPSNGSLSLFTSVSFANNLDLWGPVIGKPCATVSPTPGDDKPTGAVIGGVVAGAVLLIAAVAFGFVHWRRQKKQQNRFIQPSELHEISRTDKLDVER